MGDAETDFLSFQDIKKDLDTLYRRYLDTALIELAKKAKAGKDHAGYWKAVVGLRAVVAPSYKEKPGAGVLEPDSGVSRMEQVIKAIEAKEPSKEPSTNDWAKFLYWFDMRANYWSHGVAKGVSEALVSSLQLKTLFDKALELSKRVTAFRKRSRDEKSDEHFDRIEDFSKVLAHVMEKVAPDGIDELSRKVEVELAPEKKSGTDDKNKGGGAD